MQAVVICARGTLPNEVYDDARAFKKRRRLFTRSQISTPISLAFANLTWQGGGGGEKKKKKNKKGAPRFGYLHTTLPTY